MLRLEAVLHRFRGGDEAVRRARRHIDEIAGLERVVIDRSAAKHDAARARHLHDDRVVLADEIEGLRPVIAAEAELRIDPRREGRELVIRSGIGRLARGQVLAFLPHAGLP